MRTQALAAAVILFASSIGGQPQAGSADSSGLCTAAAQAYWQQFRAAARRGSPQQLADLASFPFTLKPTLDGGVERQIGRDEFIEHFPALLAFDPGLAATPTTMRSMLDRHGRLASRFCNTKGNQFRVGAWLFKLKPEGWRFVQAGVE